MDGIYTENGINEKWTISETRGSSIPNKARNVDRTFHDFYLTIKDAALAKSLKDLLAYYPRCEIDLARIIGIGGEGTVLKDSSERLNLSFFYFAQSQKIMRNRNVQS